MVIQNDFARIGRMLPIRDKTEVLVVGGGTAGVVATIAAARMGAKTLVVDKNDFLGGLLSGGPCGWHSFFNVYHRYPGAKKVQLVRGIAQETVDRLKEMGGGLGHIELEKGFTFSVLTAVDPEIYKYLAMEMVLESGAHVLLHAFVSGVLLEGNRVRGIIIESKSGKEVILADVIIDTTGDADIAAWAGAPYTKVDSMVSLNFRMVNVDMDKVGNTFVEKGIVDDYARGIKIGEEEKSFIRVASCQLNPWAGELKKRNLPFRRLLSIVSVRKNDATYINITRSIADILDVRSLTEAEIELRRQVIKTVQFFKECIPGFEKAYLVSTGPTLGVRKSRVIHTLYDLTEEDVLKGKGFSDEIGRFAFIDMPGANKFVEDAGSFGIPYRCLLPKNTENVLIAGRSMSTQNVPHQATRNVACCMVTGQAAGTAAALSIQHNVPPRQVDIKELQALLVAQGMELDLPAR